MICLKDCLDGMGLLEGHCLQVYAGVTMARAAVFAAKNGLSGLEFAHGIPGTVGGGVYMNAGAYGSDISRVCVRAGSGAGRPGAWPAAASYNSGFSPGPPGSAGR